MKSMDERQAAIKKQLRGGKKNTIRELSEAIGEEENDEELDKPDDRRMVDGIWPDELEKTRNRVQVGDRLKVMLLADTRTKGEVRTVRRTVRVISKHRYLVAHPTEAAVHTRNWRCITAGRFWIGGSNAGVGEGGNGELYENTL